MAQKSIVVAAAVAAAALALPGDAGRDIATMLFSELVIRTMYGVDFASPFAPSEDAVRDRLDPHFR